MVNMNVDLKILFCALQLLYSCQGDTFVERSSTKEELLLMTGDGCQTCVKGCPHANISYYLYTRYTQDSPYQLDPSNPDTIVSANFIKGAPLKLIIHGYTGYKDFAPNAELRPAYFEHGEYNIITVDWGDLALQPCYIEAAENLYTVAQCAAELLDYLYTTHEDLELRNTHIIGFSLGAHVAGLLGNNLQTGRVARVTGLDPAMPLLDDLSKSHVQMINSAAAEFVDVYHSNAGVEGKKAACGHIDVYFNDGSSQPGCDCTSSCDHKRSVQYFAESINSVSGLWGFPCADWESYIGGSCAISSVYDLVNLGNSISTNLTHGSYLAFTNSASPFLLDPYVYLEDSELASKVKVNCTMSEYLQNMG